MANDFKVNFEIVKSQFFDRAVTSRLSDAARKVLSAFGAFVRTSARSSIKVAPWTGDGGDRSALWTKRKPSRRRATSRPGDPPYARRANSPIRMIYFHFDRQDQSVIVGPIGFGSRPGEATDALEDGGTTTLIRKRRFRTTREKVRIAARPFMRPAFEKNLPHLRRWRNSVK